MKRQNIRSHNRAFITIAGLLTALSASSVMGNALEEEVQLFCDKMTQCASPHLDGLPSDNAARQMIESVLADSCQTMKQEFAVLSSSSAQRDAAVSCLKSMNALVCTDLEEEFETPECQELAELVE
ncbi:hypothetical protein L4C38_02905 [Vibrio kasasachensis]|uniref:hypothetical protein n=1 Tax=Vibrio kasasachensis TaxID=2910248 RepID=UPI003D100240